MNTLRIEEMTWVQVKEAMAQGYRRVIFALGSTEQHGPHLPLATDTLIGDMLALRIAEKLGNTLVAPTIRPGCSEHHMNFPGSLSISSDLLSALARAYCESLARHGFESLLLLPSHGGNFPVVKRIVPELQNLSAKVIGFSNLAEFQQVIDGIAARFGVTPSESGAHAGCSETSLILAEHADLVHMDQAQVGFIGDFIALAQNVKASSAGLELRMDDISPLGVLGDPRGARAELGRELLEGLAERLTTFYREALGSRP
ncbi:MAG: creatininase family protein [Chloroflexi bacterium]|nr:creatininase family protein [Chloroflexota bacterium]